MCGIYASFTTTTTNNSSIKNVDKQKIKYRGPDDTFSIQQKIKFEENLNLFIDLTFHRLEINGINDTEAQQPFFKDDIYMMCNGEIYNHKELQEKYNTPSYTSDCRIILYLYSLFEGDFHKVIELLDGEFAIVLFDYSKKFHYKNKSVEGVIFTSRDKFGVRPLFSSLNGDHTLIFSSEAKAIDKTQECEAFPPSKTIKYEIYNNFGNCNGNGNRISIKHSSTKTQIHEHDLEKDKVVSLDNIYQLLENAVSKRITNRDEDVDIGFLLSGGLDSSIICGISSQLTPNKKIKTFSIGIVEDNLEPTKELNPDLFYAREVAEYIGSNHHEVIVKTSEALDSIPEVIRILETYDTTTIRASVPMYLLCKYIKQKYPNMKVLLSGEGADELFGGYLYFRNAPSPKEFKEETQRLLDNLYMYDNLRADRTVSSNGLELRVPFLDYQLTSYVLNTISGDHLIHGGSNIEKMILRKVCSCKNLIPKSVICRTKDAFSDAVGYDWKDKIKEYVSKKDFFKNEFDYCVKPRTIEEEYYLYEYNKYYPNLKNVKEYWHPKWQPKELIDPSARMLFPS